jgi:GNAT superfamily N-acetyltransferase
MLDYRRDTALAAEQIAELYRRAELRRPVDDLPRIEAMFVNASLVWSAWDGKRLVGVARSLTDWRYVCYLSDLAVDPDYQKQGIGKALIDRTQESIGDECTLLLLSAPRAMEYYPKVGFEKVENGWIIHRAR